MSLKLEEGKGLEWNIEEVIYGYGFHVSKVPYFKNVKLESVQAPTKGTVVYRKLENKNDFIPILIKDGQYLVNGRLSNYWYWFKVNDDLTLGELESGYGGFYKSPYKFNVKTTHTVELESD